MSLKKANNSIQKVLEYAQNTAPYIITYSDVKNKKSFKQFVIRSHYQAQVQSENFSETNFLNSNVSPIHKYSLFDEVLPPGVRIIDLASNYVVFERPFETIPIRYKHAIKASSRDDVVTKITLPWQVYVLYFSYLDKEYNIANIYYFWRNKPLQSVNSSVYAALVPNIYENGRVCLPALRGCKNLTELINHAVECVWSSQTNLDLLPSSNLISLLKKLKNDNPKVPERFKGFNFYDNNSDRAKYLPTENAELNDVLNQCLVPYDDYDTGSDIIKGSVDLDGDEVLGGSFIPLESMLTTNHSNLTTNSFWRMIHNEF